MIGTFVSFIRRRPATRDYGGLFSLILKFEKTKKPPPRKQSQVREGYEGGGVCKGWRKRRSKRRLLKGLTWPSASTAEQRTAQDRPMPQRPAVAIPGTQGHLRSRFSGQAP